MANATAIQGREHPYRQLFELAASEFDVPAGLLMSIGWVESRWSMGDGLPTLDHSYGIMGLRSRRGFDTLGRAADLIGLDPEQLKSDPVANIRGAAALLRDLANASSPLPNENPETWESVLFEYSGATDEYVGLDYASQVFYHMHAGVSQDTLLGTVEIPRTEIDFEMLRHYRQLAGHKIFSLTDFSDDYPPALWVPAHPNNYTVANRPASDPITYIIIHITDGTYSSAISRFQNGSEGVSAHYVIRSFDGQITQMVRHKDIAYHAGNFPYNQRSIGIEHEAKPFEPVWFTTAMYQASASLTRFIADFYGIPKTRTWIRGHSEVPCPCTSNCPDSLPGTRPAQCDDPLKHTAHTSCKYGGILHKSNDPGPNWDWNYYMQLVQGGGQTLSVSLSALPESGTAPLSTTLSADVSGTAQGTINYTFWWNCNDPGASVGTVMSICGSIPTPAAGSCASNANGIKCDAVSSDPKEVSHPYSTAGTYTAKVIAERGSAPPAERRKTVTVTSPSTQPAVTTQSASNIGQTQARLSAYVNPNGSSTDVFFDFGPSTSYGQTVSGGNIGTTAGTVNRDVNGLNCGTLYHFRGWARNSGGTDYGDDRTFTTSACPQQKPEAVTNAASNVTSTGATLSGYVNPNGSSTTVYFDYGTTSLYGSSVQIGNIGTTAQTVSTPVSGLQCNTAYHFRVRASNAAGTTYGDDRVFTTSSCGGQCTQDFTLSCGDSDFWSNNGSGSTNAIQSYSCLPCPNCEPWDYSGPEYTYVFDAPADTHVQVSLTNLSDDLDLVVLRELGTGCTSGNCISHDVRGGTSSELARFGAASGHRYYFVVDGFGGAVSSYAIQVTCDGPTFEDVPSGHTYFKEINGLYNAGVTKGCSASPRLFCPLGNVTRADMAVFIERALHGRYFDPPQSSGIFSDVSLSDWQAPWIEALYHDGITNGCGVNPLQFCPAQNMTRAQMAASLLRARHGASYSPPPATGIFTDVPVTHWAAPWIEQLYREGITNGCSVNPRLYCPDDYVTRQSMAAFLVRTFSIPFP